MLGGGCLNPYCPFRSSLTKERASEAERWRGGRGGCRPCRPPATSHPSRGGVGAGGQDCLGRGHPATFCWVNAPLVIQGSEVRSKTALGRSSDGRRGPVLARGEHGFPRSLAHGTRPGGLGHTSSAPG